MLVFAVGFIVFGLFALALALGLLAGGRPLKIGCASRTSAGAHEHDTSCGSPCRRVLP